MLNKFKIWLHEYLESRFTKAFHHELNNLQHSKMIEEAEHLASRPSISTIANAPRHEVKKAA